MAKTYNVTVTDSNRELTAREKVKVLDVSDMINLNEAIREQGSITFTVDLYVATHVENAKSESKEYDRYILKDTEDNWYTTGSESFATKVRDLIDICTDEDIPVEIKCFAKPSKNFAGNFLTCSLI